jgi:hypothetical protein
MNNEPVTTTSDIRRHLESQLPGRLQTSFSDALAAGGDAGVAGSDLRTSLRRCFQWKDRDACSLVNKILEAYGYEDRVMTQREKLQARRTTRFLANFPAVAGPMTNCLTDLACPQCGCRDGLQVEAKRMVALLDDGTDDVGGDTEYDENSFMRCDCGTDGRKAIFTFDGLDDALEARRAAQSGAEVEPSSPVTAH